METKMGSIMIRMKKHLIEWERRCGLVTQNTRTKKGGQSLLNREIFLNIFMSWCSHLNVRKKSNILLKLEDLSRRNLPALDLLISNSLHVTSLLDHRPPIILILLHSVRVMEDV